MRTIIAIGKVKVKIVPVLFFNEGVLEDWKYSSTHSPPRH